MEKPSEFLLDLIEKNNIHGCMVLIREDQDGNCAISHAEDNIHEINIIQSLATIIHDKAEKKDSHWSQCMRNSADTIIRCCEMIKDLSEEI